MVNLLKEKTGSEWHRTVDSGARSTSQGIEEAGFAGDIWSPDYARVVVECKCRKEPVSLSELHHLKSWFNEIVHQSRMQAKGEPWILFFTWNYGPIYMVWEHQHLDVIATKLNACNIGALYNNTTLAVVE